MPTPRQILRDNLRRLMAENPRLDTIKKVCEASGLSNGKVGRIYAASHATDVDALADLAKAFGLQPWQLLVVGLKSKSPPRIIDASTIEQIRMAVEAAQLPQMIDSEKSRKVARHKGV